MISVIPILKPPLAWKLFRNIPKWLKSILTSIYSVFLPPFRIFPLFIPQKNFWIVKEEDSVFFLPSEERIVTYLLGLPSRLKEIRDKYTFDPFVKVEKGDIVCDVGAYIGAFSIAVENKASKIIAIEPDPLCSLLLKQNLKNLENVQVIKKFLWKEKSSIKLKLGYWSGDSTTFDIDFKRKSRRRAVNVKAAPLNNLLSKLGIDNIDFLKIDAEGAEPEVLQGAKNLFDKGKIEKIAVDCGPERFGRSTLSEVRRILDAQGFQIQIDKDMMYARKC